MLLNIKGFIFRRRAFVRAIALQPSRLGIVLPVIVHELSEMVLDLNVINLEQELNALVKITRHPIGRR